MLEIKFTEKFCFMGVQIENKYPKLNNLELM